MLKWRETNLLFTVAVLPNLIASYHHTAKMKDLVVDAPSNQKDDLSIRIND